MRRRGMIKTVQPNVHIHGQISGFLPTFGGPSWIVRWDRFVGQSVHGEHGIALRTQLRWSSGWFLPRLVDSLRDRFSWMVQCFASWCSFFSFIAVCLA